MSGKARFFAFLPPLPTYSVRKTTRIVVLVFLVGENAWLGVADICLGTERDLVLAEHYRRSRPLRLCVRLFRQRDAEQIRREARCEQHLAFACDTWH